MSSVMEKYDWESHLAMNLKVMKLMGLWPPRNENRRLYSIYSAVVITLFVPFHILAQVTNIYFVFNDLEAVVSIVYILLTEFVACCKLYCVLKKATILNECISLLRSNWFQPKNLSQKEMIQRGIKFWRNMSSVLLVSAFACTTFWMIYPLLDSSNIERRLPFVAWFPFDSRVSPYYEFTYVLQVVSTNYLTLVHYHVDCIVSGFNVYIACQFDLLCDNIRKIRSSHAGEDIMKCVLHHKEILKFIKGSSQFSSLIIFWHLIMTGISIGITMFQLTLVVPFSNEFYALVSYGSAIIIQIFMYCWFGNEVGIKSDFLSYSVFESSWIDLSEGIKWNLLFFTMNVIKPVKISAFNMFYLSLDTFMRILKTAWSYFALLYQLGAQT